MDTETIQSAMHAGQGSAAAMLHQLGLIMYVGGTLIFLIVITLAIYAVYSPASRGSQFPWITLGGLLFPAIILSALLVHSLSIGGSVSLPAPDALRVHVTGKQWWWEVQYPHPDGGRFVTANELYIPTNAPVELVLSTSDVIHSFWVPALAGKVDMIPGRTTRLQIRTDESGIYRGQCAEYCGAQHAMMALHVVAVPPEHFEAWVERQAQPAATPEDPFLQLGREQFFRGGCDECHAVRGTPAHAQLGPDLTHVGSRQSLAAGVLRNHVGTMAGWIAGAQEIKPGNRMPSTSIYTGRQLRALSAWLESLE